MHYDAFYQSQVYKFFFVSSPGLFRKSKSRKVLWFHFENFHAFSAWNPIALHEYTWCDTQCRRSESKGENWSIQIQMNTMQQCISCGCLGILNRMIGSISRQFVVRRMSVSVDYVNLDVDCLQSISPVYITNRDIWRHGMDMNGQCVGNVK